MPAILLVRAADYASVTLPQPSVVSARGTALDAAVALHASRNRADDARVLDTASRFLAFLLEGPAVLAVVAAPLTSEQGDPGKSVPTVYVRTSEGDMAVQLTDTQQVDLSVQPEDTKGNPTTDSNLTWSEDSGGAVVTLSASADGTTCTVVAGQPGTANVTVSDGTISGVEAVAVVPGTASQLVINAGTPVDQPAG